MRLPKPGRLLSRLILLAALLLLSGPMHAADPPPLDQARRTDDALVVPDHFLRRWDPVTVFFQADAGPTQPAPEDQPERFVTMTPAQPGAWQWLGFDGQSG